MSIKQSIVWMGTAWISEIEGSFDSASTFQVLMSVVLPGVSDGAEQTMSLLPRP